MTDIDSLQERRNAMKDLGKGIATVGIWGAVAAILIFGRMEGVSQEGLVIAAGAATVLLWVLG